MPEGGRTMPDVLRRYILSIDQGTTSSKVMIFDHAGAVGDQASREITQFYPEPGWVEHDAVEIWHTVYDSCAEIFGRGIVLPCLLYTSDAADDLLCVDLGGRRII